ncbi:MAG: hypothetical protein E3J47_05855 [Candidatus Stahlbacteria bacterium]|nr:MAG: hypothetical protein E3J47_05855 [Candidatus Stahlbacteria bacterium]
MAQVELHYLVDKTEHKYIGRFLGFIKDDEFNAICQSRKAASKIESKETKPLIEVCKKYDTLEGYRLVIVIKKIDGDSINMDKKLFVSERLNYISSVNTKEKSAVFVSENDNNFVVQEIE